jgi:hypothetical protein
MGNYIEFADYSGNTDKGPRSSGTVSPVLDRTIQIQQVSTDYARREIVETKLIGQDGR